MHSKQLGGELRISSKKEAVSKMHFCFEFKPSMSGYNWRNNFVSSKIMPLTDLAAILMEQDKLSLVRQKRCTEFSTRSTV